MSSRPLFGFAAVLWLLVSACDSSQLLVSPPLGEPWAAMGLPGGGEVLVSHPASCSFTWPRGDGRALADQYVSALEQRGWDVVSRSDRSRSVRVHLERGPDRLVLSVIDVLGVASVTLDLRGPAR